MKKVNKNKGISLISLTVTVLVLIIISSMLIYNAKNGIKMQKLNKMQNDIEILENKIDAYYIKYGKIPAEIPYTNITFEPNPNDNTVYYVIDLTALDGISLNYGADFSKITTDTVNDYDDLYIINEQSHHVYYARGIELDGVMYYTNDTDEDIGLAITVEDLTYKKIDTGYEITLKNVKYNQSYNIKYRESNDTEYTQSGTDITNKDYTFNVDKYGLYYINIEDKIGKTKELIVSIYAGVTTDQSNGEKIKMVKSISDSGVVEEEVYLPKGFTISGVASECAQTTLGVKKENEKRNTIDDGIVMYLINDNSNIDWSNSVAVERAQETYDQFVWVPVKNAVLDLSSNSTALSSEVNINSEVRAEINAGRYPMAIKKDATNYFGVLYQFSLDSATNTVKVKPHNSWTPLTTSIYREPAFLTDTSCADESLENNVGITQNPDTLQAEFNTMVNKVSSNGGFWVGRYETSNMVSNNTKDSTNKITVIKGTTTGISNVNWYRMYAQQKIYSKLALGSSTTATSSMIWGSQWDQIMIWMKEVKNTNKNSYYVINSLTMGNFGASDDSYSDTSNPAATGCFDVKNIYDLAGNVYDWTLEAHNTSNRVRRGGIYYNGDYSYTGAVGRDLQLPYDSYTNSGSRSTLY